MQTSVIMQKAKPRLGSWLLINEPDLEGSSKMYAHHNTSTCRKCKFDLHISFKIQLKDRKPHCKVCESVKNTKKDWHKAYHTISGIILRKLNPNFLKCRDCGIITHKASFISNRCSSCQEIGKLIKVFWHKKQAEINNKPFSQGGIKPLNNSHVKAYKKHIAVITRKESERLSRQDVARLKPWLSEGLSKADRYRIKYAYDTEFQIKERLRRQLNKQRKKDGVADLIRGALCRNGNSPRAEQLLGYSIKELKLHIERQFINGMTWQAFMLGDIHIDHIMPQSSFDLSNQDEWKRCWSLSNLRPVWAQDNRKKSDKVEFLL